MTAKKRKGKGRKENNPMLFTPLNYKILGIGVLLVVLGFTAMYLENEVRGFVSLYISPIVIMAGYLTVIVAILKRDNQSTGIQSSAE
ncbi:MAG: hypothetical protein WD035_07360 [Balneolaceae bacterium]